MSGAARVMVKCVLAFAVSVGLLAQGGAAYAAPEPSPPPVTAAEGSADTGGNGGSAAESTADASSTALGAAAGDDSTNGAADVSAEADAGVDGGSADASGVGADAGAGTTAEADGAEASDQTADASAVGAEESDPSQTAPPEEGASGEDAPDEDLEELPEGAIDESLGAERATRSLSAQSLSSGFNAGYIISDQNFYNGNALSVSQIQSFLNQKVGRCTIGDSGRKPGTPIYESVVAQKCLANSTHDSVSRGANAYCKAFAGRKSETAASIISRVSQACSISPRVLMIMLEKEQSLVQDTWPTSRQFSVAMGYACPDSGPGNSANCNSKYFGFANQVYYGAWQLQVYKAHPNNYNYKPFRTNTIQWHRNAGCGTSQVYIENYATAALYIYTPYRPNEAALNAGWGEGDSCSSYGNRNFYQFYKSWFGAPNSAFPDVSPNSKFYKEIEWMAATGLTTGIKTSDGRTIYSPKGPVTREAMAAFLYRLEGANYKAPARSPFADMKPGDRFYREITWMYAKGYSTGIKQGSQRIYAPKSQVSREAMAAFIYRIQGGKYTGPAKSPFADMRRGDKFYNEITWMYARGYTTGINQGGTRVYAPKNSVTREAMAAFIYRLEH